jgi:hypothetical protein
MPTLAPEVQNAAYNGIDTPVTIAGNLAADNWALNLVSLRATGSPVVEMLTDSAPELEWVFGRDGTLTGRTMDGRWWADCSVPLLAARALLSTLEPDPLSSCLLSPGHIGLVLASRERMGAGPALIVIEPNLDAARVILSCHAFSAEITSHQLWFVCGPEWAVQLRRLFDDHRGLATPARFIRTKLTLPELADSLIAEAQAVFSAVLESRVQVIADLKSNEPIERESGKTLLIGGSQFQLWNDGTDALQEALSDRDVLRFDTDHPLSTSPIALIEAARACGSIVSADLCRADSTSGVSMELPWITWMTQPAAPPFETAGPRDALILADPAWRSIARTAGWPDDRVHICGWPSSNRLDCDSIDVVKMARHGSQASRLNSALLNSAMLGMICDTEAIEIPKAVDEFSSHRVLWEMIESELHSTPLAVENPDEYLSDRAGQMQIDLETLDRPRFIRNLIIPAYQQGLARILLASDLPIRIWGRGWADISEFHDHSEGPLTDRTSFDAAVAGCRALVYCWPARMAHPIDATGKPVLHRLGRETALLVRNARRLLTAPVPASGAAVSNGLGKTLLEILPSHDPARGRG